MPRGTRGGVLRFGAARGATLGSMPTSRRRHTITEVGSVEKALDRVRAATGEPDIRELVVLGADVLLERQRVAREREGRREELRRRLIDRASTGEGIDLVAATEVRRGGWSRTP